MDNRWQNYLQKCYALAATLTVKMSFVSAKQNTFIEQFYGQTIDPDAPETWKYFLNMCGKYHSTDAMLRVRSLDTQEMIDFTQENLAIHTYTKEAYVWGSRYWRELVTYNQQQEPLIRGILYPANLQHAVAADEGAILSYPPELVEEAEITLIDSLEDWTKRFVHHWFNRAYTLMDGEYIKAFMAIMASKLTLVIIN